MMTNQDFIHLYSSSDYSLLTSTLKPERIAECALMNKMAAIAMRDNNLFGALEFSTYCAQRHIQPIIAMDVEMKFTSAGKKCKLGLFVQNENGYKNLLTINQKIAFAKSKSQTLEWVDIFDNAQSCDGLILLTGYEFGLVGLLGFDDQGFEPIILKLKEYFPDRMYIEISRHGYEWENDVENKSLQLAQNYSLPIVATNQIMFAAQKSHDAHDALICIGEGSYIHDESRRRFSLNHYFKSTKQMCDLFADLPSALTNSVMIAKRCSFYLTKKAPSLPRFSENEKDELIDMTNTMFQNMPSLCDKQEYKARLEFELDAICRMGFAGYFLIVADFIKWAKDHGIYVGPGRGSAAGSLVAYILKITDVDPLPFGLLFERFLNPGRVSMPDIDIDFCPFKRGDVINYIKEKYGHDRVAHIITFGALQAKAVLRDVGRVLGLPYSKVDAICRLIPFNPVAPVSLKEAIDLDSNLRAQALEDEQVGKLLSIGLELEGILRNQSTHAAGVVIGAESLHNIIPVHYDQDGTLITGFHMKPLEQSGLVKFDFLGLSTLTLLEKTCDLINLRHGLKINLSELALDDSPTYNMLCTGLATGIFQLDSSIMKDGLKRLLPSCIEDIIALVSLNRPGPMENVPEYIARKFGRSKIDYLHPLLEGLLRETFGIIVYQEQVMEIAKILAGYSLADADLLRRAMGKKIKEEMDQQKEIFMKGAAANGVERSKAGSIFDLVLKFAGYGFNKSHATAYAIISYYTAWLKTHYSLEFFTALLNLEIGNTDKLALIIVDARIHKIKIEMPCVNKSHGEFTIDPQGSVQYALHAIKGVGDVVAEKILAERKTNGQFEGLVNFLERFDSKVLNKKTLENLIYAGAMDCFFASNNDYNRATLIAGVESMIKYIAAHAANQNQLTLFSESEMARFEINTYNEFTDDEMLDNERGSVGFYLSKNPLDMYADYLKKNKAISSIDSISPGQIVNMAGVIMNIRIRSSKRGKFADLSVLDNDGLLELFIYDSDLIMNNGSLLNVGKVIFFTVKAMSNRDGGSTKLVINSLYDLRMNVVSEKSVFEIMICEDIDLDKLIEIFGPFSSFSESENQIGKTYYILNLIKDSCRIEIKIPQCFRQMKDFKLIYELDGISGPKRIY